MKLRRYLYGFFNIAKIYIKNNLYGCLIFVLFFLAGLVLGLSVSSAGTVNGTKYSLILLYDYRYFSVFFEFAVTFLIAYFIILICSFNKITLYLSLLLTLFYSYKLGLATIIYPQILGLMGVITLIFILFPLYVISIIILHLTVLNLLSDGLCVSFKNFSIGKKCFKKNLLKILKYYAVNLFVIFLYTIVFAWLIVFMFYSV